MKLRISILILILALYSCKKESKTSTETKTETEIETTSENEWITLFDGSSTKGWRSYNGEALPPQWVIKDSTLTFDAEVKDLKVEHQGGRDIIYGAEEFDNFELYLEWKIPAGGNTGIFYHLKEGYDNPYEVSPEYQMIDDENYAKMHDLVAYNTGLGHPNPELLQSLQQTASDYAMYVADDKVKVLHPAGQWNSTKIIFTPEVVEHWLNGKKVLSFVPWSDDWYAKKNNGKWKDFPDYGKFKTGFIGLQDHDSPVWFKNIKIKKL
jgi:hypothetical protein